MRVVDARPQDYKNQIPLFGGAETATAPPLLRLFWNESNTPSMAQVARVDQCIHIREQTGNIACFLFRSTLEILVSQKLAAGKNVTDALVESIPIATASLPGGLSCASSRELIKNIYIATGVDSVSFWEASREEQLYAGYCAGMVIYLEEYDALDFKARCIKLKMRLDDVIGGGERATTLFFARRATCSCLTEKKRLVKHYPKTSVCCVCNEIRERKSLKRCGNCNIVQYCSRHCQKADWQLHKGQCQKLSDFMKEGKKK